jgi:AcrR family transcriptional regulator
MNHVPSHILSADARPLTRRALAKLRTRQALLAAGKQLFTERGYEQATVRDIARAAGMSTGAVFANFQDKSDLFGEILANDYESLAETMRQIAGVQDRSVREALLVVLAAGYAFHLKQLPLLQAAIGVSWSHTPEEEARTRAGLAQIKSVLEQVLRRGVAAAEIRQDADIDLVVDLVWTAYRSNYRLAVYDGFDLDALTQRLERQLDVILNAVKV